MFWELADASLEAGSATLKGAGWLTQTAIEMQTEQMKLMFGTSTIEDWQRRYDQIVAAGEGAERLVDAALEAKTNWAKLVKNNPRKAVEKIAEVEGVVEGELLTMAMQEIIGGGLVKGTQMLSNARKAGKVRAGLTEGAETAEALAGTGAKTLATADEAAKAIPGLGNLSEKQISYFKSVLKRLSEKYGIEIELQARPVNEFSTRIAGGIGKVEAVPTKNITLEDTMMGAPEKWLGQTAYYKPKLPKNLGELGAAQQEKFKLRYDEKLKEYLQFIGEKADPSGKAAKVEKMLKPGGAEVSLGKNYKAQIELAKTVDKDSGAILIQYKKLEVNGQKIFTGKPRPIISDIDFNAVVNAATGRALPAGIRGQVELELMNDFSKAAKDGLFPFGFHGWTHSGFDLIAAAGQAPSSLETFSFVSKYMLMYATKEQAAAFAAKWAPKLGTTPEKLLEGFTTGKHLVKITKDKAVLGPGANPVLGIGTP
jgi:hypothetical protein